MIQNKTNQLEQRLGHSFSNKDLLFLALSHRSVGAKNNERLEFLGDALLGSIISQRLFMQFPQAREGELTRMRSQLVRGDTLAEIAMEFNLGEELNLGEGELKSGGFRRASILADAMEAIIGAIFLDSDIEIAKERVLTWYSSRLEDLKVDVVEKDPKTRLQEYLQEKRLPLPEYATLQELGEAHNREFVIECSISKPTHKASASNSSKRAAEKHAAQKILEKLGVK